MDDNPAQPPAQVVSEQSLNSLPSSVQCLKKWGEEGGASQLLTGQAATGGNGSRHRPQESRHRPVLISLIDKKTQTTEAGGIITLLV